MASTYKWNALSVLPGYGGNGFPRRQDLLVVLNQLLQEGRILRAGILFGRQVLDLSLDVPQVLQKRPDR